MSMVEVHQMVGQIARLLEEKHGLKGRDLATKLRRGRRLLPRRLRSAADNLALAEDQVRNPKLWARIDLGQLTQDYDACMRHLAAIDTDARRRGRLMGMVESVGIGVLMLGIILAAVLLWPENP